MDKLPDIGKIANGEIKSIEEEEHKVLFALCAGLINHLKEFDKKEEIDNVLKFSMELPSEFSIMLVKDMQKNSIGVESAPSWEIWVRKFSYLLS
jgi:hypothetical protein